MKNKKNLAQIIESWTPAVKQITNNRINESTPDKLAWVCEYAHNHVMALNEDATAMTGGATFPFQTLYNTNGIGNAVPASFAGQTAADQSNINSFGSGDKWPALLPMALQVAGRTIAFDLVNNFPLQGPTGVIPYLDYVYSGSKDVYGATPARDASTANPYYGPNKGMPAGTPAYEMYDAPHAFRCKLIPEDSSTSKRECIEAIFEACKPAEDGTPGFITLNEGTDAALDVQIIGVTRLSAEPMFKVMPGQTKMALGKVFGAENKIESVTAGDYTFTLRGARLISALEDHIQGFTGAGKYDDDNWAGTYQNPFKLYEPMDRATGEMQYPRQMSLRVFTKFVQVGTQSVAVAVTQEQVQDLQKQWGIDVLKMVENAAINELSQSINKHILSRLFALGWRNHIQAYEAEGVNLNINLTAEDADEVGFATYDEEGEAIKYMPLNKPTTYGDGSFENRDTIYKTIGVSMLYAGNTIMQRGRRGPANFIVTNYKIATMLQANSQYAFSPIANTFNQNNGSLYPLGTIAGMTLYVDPMMGNYDTRVLVGRKGDKDEPGLVFAPYIMAESIKLIAEQTASPKVLIKSRYALIDLGWYPWLNYITFYAKTPETL